MRNIAHIWNMLPQKVKNCVNLCQDKANKKKDEIFQLETQFSKHFNVLYDVFKVSSNLSYIFL